MVSLLCGATVVVPDRLTRNYNFQNCVQGQMEKDKGQSDLTVEEGGKDFESYHNGVSK